MSCCRATHTPSAVPWISSEGVCCGALRSGRMICVCVWCMTVRKLAPFWPNRNRCCCEVTSSCVLTITPVTPASASAPSSSSIRTQVAFCRGQRSVIDSVYACESVPHLDGSGVSLRSSHAAGAAEEFGLRPEADAHSERLSHVLNHRRARVTHHTPHKGHRQVKGQHQGL